ncbi:unnamed protein product [Ceutorhynchus assimilis]|uniref:Uncharacterized protein n=1 Tax=Ceutorhynchus assimilis TaxID=467358 RepID=A0A9N9QPT0_9CUCU|nr:unnamed protein product [Ceutorhynchus assimilis]
MYVLKIFLLVTVLAYVQAAVLDPVETLEGLELTHPLKALSRNRRQDGVDPSLMEAVTQPQERFLGGLLEKVPSLLIKLVSGVIRMIMRLITGGLGD